MSQQRLNSLSMGPRLSWCGWGVFVRRQARKETRTRILCDMVEILYDQKKKNYRLHTVYYYLLYIYLHCRHCAADFVKRDAVSWCTFMYDHLTAWYCRRQYPKAHIHSVLILTNAAVWRERLGTWHEHGLAEPSSSSELSLSLGWKVWQASSVFVLIFGK